MSSPQANSFEVLSLQGSGAERFISCEIRYRGHRIVWDTRPVRGLPSVWTGKAAVVMPPDPEDVEKVHGLGYCGYFLREEDARDHLIQAAKEWIDSTLGAEKHREH